MTVFVCGISALEFWEALDEAFDFARLAKLASVEGTAGPKDAEIICNDLLSRLSPPIHLASEPGIRRHSTTQIKWVRAKSYAGAKYLRVREGVFVAEPALALLQASASVDKIELLYRACRLAALFNVSDDSMTGLTHRDPMLTRAAAQKLAKKAAGAYGVKNFAFAANYMCDCAASPMEIVLAEMLSLPLSAGGYGLASPELNKEIPLSKFAKSIADSSYYVADLCWYKSKVIVEYDSNAHHLTPAEKAHDEIRRGALEEAGFKIISVGSKQLHSVDKLDACAAQIKRALGLRVRCRATNIDIKRLNLLKKLLSY